jgi:hypothetical protein
MGTSTLKYRILDLPTPEPAVLNEFNELPFDEFTGGRQRYRRFSQFRMSFSPDLGRWQLELLPHRPFIQPPSVNRLVGGVPRPFEPLRINPEPQINVGALALGLDINHDWQVNVHQCRVIAKPGTPGVSVPEGPHRDGHDYGMLAVFGRDNITGGENQLMPVGGGDPFFTVTLQPMQALVYEDPSMWHTATDIAAEGGHAGHRDLWIVAFNRWDRRKYGDEFEKEVLAGSSASAR